jgi:inner membrane protein COX18
MTTFSHSPYALIEATELMLDTVHQHTHLPWWAVVVGSTLVLRGVVTLPLAIYQSKMVTKQELLLPRLKVLQEQALHRVVVMCRKANKPHTEANRIYRKEV